jgi:hypothetical protein
MAILRQTLIALLVSVLPGVSGIVMAEENGLIPGGVVIELLVDPETGFTSVTSPSTQLLVTCRALEGQFILERGAFNGIGAGCTVESIEGSTLAVELQEAVENILVLTGGILPVGPIPGGGSPTVPPFITIPTGPSQSQTIVPNLAVLQTSN